MNLWECFKYLAVIGMAGFILGRLIPKRWMQWDKRPFKLWSFEDEGKIYNCLKIRKWQNKIPDMSKIFKRIMPEKKMPEQLSEESVALMLRETCVAELIHLLLGLGGLYCIFLWPGLGGWLIALAYLLGNLPFVFVQRFNRPKFHRLLLRIRKNSSSSFYSGKGCQLCGF